MVKQRTGDLVDPALDMDVADLRPGQRTGQENPGSAPRRNNKPGPPGRSLDGLRQPLVAGRRLGQDQIEADHGRFIQLVRRRAYTSRSRGQRPRTPRLRASIPTRTIASDVRPAAPNAEERVMRPDVPTVENAQIIRSEEEEDRR